jgi:hypothetical protein
LFTRDALANLRMNVQEPALLAVMPPVKATSLDAAIVAQIPRMVLDVTEEQVVKAIVDHQFVCLRLFSAAILNAITSKVQPAAWTVFFAASALQQSNHRSGQSKIRQQPRMLLFLYYLVATSNQPIKKISLFLFPQLCRRSRFQRPRRTT